MKIFQLDIMPLYYENFLKKITQLQDQKIVFTPNPEMCLKTLEDNEFLEVLQQADYLTSDGIGLYIAYQILDNTYGKIINTFFLPYYFFNLLVRRKYLYKKYGDRICGSDMTLDVMRFCQENDIKIAIIDLHSPGDRRKEQYQHQLGPKLEQHFPGLRFDYHIYADSDQEDIQKHISQSGARVLFSTLGMKTQELSIIHIMRRCNNIKLGMGVGSSFDYISGFQKRAPKIMRQAGLEWFYRIFTSPGKIRRLQRIYQAVGVFPYKVLMTK